MKAIDKPTAARIVKIVGLPVQSPVRYTDKNELLLHTKIPELISRNGV